MTSTEDLLLPFARAIHAKATALRSLELTSSQRARLHESISDDIKKCTNFLTPEISEAALKRAARLGVNLRDKNWHDQPRFDKGRKTFHFEHIIPVATIRESCIGQNSERGILRVLRQQLRVVWILKAEDAELTRLGYRSIRPDPDAAYRKANIQLASAQQRAPRGRPRFAGIPSLAALARRR